MKSFLSKAISERDENQQLNTPLLWVILVLMILVLVHGLNPYLPAQEQHISIGIGISGILYTLLYFHVLIPRISLYPSVKWIMVALNGLLTAVVIGLEPMTSLRPIFLILIIAAFTSTAILSGRLPAYLLVGMTSLAQSVFGAPVGVAGNNNLWLEAISYPFIGTLIIESTLVLRNTIHAQVRRLQILNNAARSLASSLEIHQVIALVSSAIQDSLDADTYFVGLMEGKNAIRLDLFYDDGEFFPPMCVPLENTLAGWVIANRRALLLQDVEKDSKQLGISYAILGKPKNSRSWMGTPLESGGKVLGIVAIASYEPAAFHNADLELIQNIAQQASMAIDNAFHHADVEKQSTLDSLTGALNHGYFLKTLASKADSARMIGSNLSLIMLDVDYFKQYNDNYGHLVGDQVLCELTTIIRKHIKNTDLVGRWGGEEFVIALLNANGAQAFEVARRIQSSMNELTIIDRDDTPIPSPTVSQGIAVFPTETDSIYTLIDLADQRLYIAKESGRNQIGPRPDHWSKKFSD